MLTVLLPLVAAAAIDPDSLAPRSFFLIGVLAAPRVGQSSCSGTAVSAASGYARMGRAEGAGQVQHMHGLLRLQEPSRRRSSNPMQRTLLPIRTFLHAGLDGLGACSQGIA